MLEIDVLLALRPQQEKHILQAATHVYSQNFEDAIIAEIFRRIGTRTKTFVEIGVFDGIECNTRLLLERGWRGVWIEGDATALLRARKLMSPYLQNGQLQIVQSKVTPGNVQDLINSSIAGPIDFLSVDVDYNTSHIWRAVSARARASCIEYNASHPPTCEWEVTYDESCVWDGTNHYGASLKTLELIGRQKRQSLVGCDIHGVNAFFVNDEECGDMFIQPCTAEQHFEPPRFSMIGHRGHRPKDIPRATVSAA